MTAIQTGSLKIELPAWAEEMRNTLLTGRECYLVWEPEEQAWYVKTVRCNKCGKCCRGPFPGDWPPSTQQIGPHEYCGGIKEAGGEFWCEAVYVPTSCVFDTPHSLPHEDCVMKYEKLE